MSESAHSKDPQRERNAPGNTTTAQIGIPATEFAFSALFERIPDARVELEPAIAIPDDQTLLVVRVAECDYGTVENALRADPAVGMVERFGERDEEQTYRVTWDGCARRLVGRIVAEDTTLLSARARNGRWRFQLVAPDRDAFASAYDAIEDLGYTPDCRSISTFEGGRAGCSSLTDTQQETLVAAFEAGYYDIPRDATGKEFADILGISHQALSERLRRGMNALVKDTFNIGNETGY